MKSTVSTFLAFFSISLGLLSCGSDSSAPPENPPTDEPPGNVPEVTYSTMTQVYSAGNLGVIITTLPPLDNSPGCFVEYLETRQSSVLSNTDCQELTYCLTTSSRYCQVVQDGEPISLNISNCKLMVKDGVEQPTIDDSGRRAATNTNATLAFYKDNFERDGIDGRGGDAISLVHYSETSDDVFYHFLFGLMCYGDGDEMFRDLTYGLDVAGHEISHAVMRSEVDWINKDETGAVAEAVSDYFGLGVQGTVWTIGTTVTLDGKGLRNLANPAALTDMMPRADGILVPTPYPAHVRDKFTRFTSGGCVSGNDSCWIHFNSTIFGHALYQIHQAIGRTRTRQIVYLAETQYFTVTTTFQDAADALALACAQLYPRNVCAEVEQALSHVGLEIHHYGDIA